MTSGVRFHVLLLPNTDWPELKRRALWLESLNIDLLAVADHFVDWTNPATPWFESWTTLSALAHATSSIRLTTLVSQIPLRNPAVLARQALTLDHISEGRLEVGLGTGLSIDPAYPMIGVPNWSAGERVARFEEYVEIVHRMLGQEVTSFIGKHYQIEGAVMNPRPIQTPRPPLIVAALGPRMLHIAARHADIWNSLSFKPTFDEQIVETRQRGADIEAACQAIGRDPATLRRSYTMFDAQARPRGGLIEYLGSREMFA
ncbi:MAG: LLM class flavin-dependent oxidoreductase [Thermomicrobiales bacterium]